MVPKLLPRVLHNLGRRSGGVYSTRESLDVDHKVRSCCSAPEQPSPVQQPAAVRWLARRGCILDAGP